jgi:tetratricopeptide (TPR) repeat protein
MKLQEALLKCTRQFGREVLKERRLIFMLLDYHAFRDYPAMKKVVKALLSGGYVNELYSRSRSASRSDYLSYAGTIKKSLAADMHFRKELADYAVDSVSLALGMLESVREPFDPYESGERSTAPDEVSGTDGKTSSVLSGFRMKWLAVPLAAAAAVTVIVLLVLNNAAFQNYRGEKLYSEQNYGAALKQFGKAADKGNVDALLKLGRMYETGTGVTQDQKKALEFYRRAMKLGSADAETRYDSLRRSMEDPSAGYCAPLPEGASDEEMMGWNSMCL